MKPYTPESVLEELVREFCKESPRLRTESGMAFYERLKKFAQQAHEEGERVGAERASKRANGEFQAIMAFIRNVDPDDNDKNLRAIFNTCEQASLLASNTPTT